MGSIHRHSRLKITLQRIACGVLLVCGTAYASADKPRIPPDQSLIQIGSMQEPLKFSLLPEAALRASGVEEDLLESHRQYIEMYLDRIQNSLQSESTSLPPGDSLLRYLHRTILKRYDERQTRIDVLMRSGDYNCVSSSVLCILAAKKLGLEVRGVEVPSHVFCILESGKAWIDVETTNRYGFDPGRKKEFRDSFGQMTGFVYVPATHYAKREILSEKRLISLILNNRMAQMQARPESIKFIEMAANRYALSNDKEAQNAFVSAVANYAGNLNQKGKNSQAVEFLTSVSKQYGLDDELSHVLKMLTHTKVLEVINKDHWDEAEHLLSDHRTLLSEESRKTLTEYITSKILERGLDSSDFIEGINLIDGLYKKNRIGKEKWEEHIAYLYLKETERISRKKDSLAAHDFLQQSPPHVRDILSIKKTLEVYGIHLDQA